MGFKFFTKAMIWENIHISCDVFRSLEDFVNTEGGGLIGIGSDSVYEYPPYGSPGAFEPYSLLTVLILR